MDYVDTFSTSALEERALTEARLDANEPQPDKAKHYADNLAFWQSCRQSALASFVRSARYDFVKRLDTALDVAPEKLEDVAVVAEVPVTKPRKPDPGAEGVIL